MTAKLEIEGVEHGGWLGIEVNKSIENLAGAFALALTDRWGGSSQPMSIVPGAKCKVTIDGETVIDGYVDTVELSIEAETHTIRVSGRDKAGDLIDCAAASGTGEWKNLKLEDLITQLVQPFGLMVKAEVDTGEKIPKFNVEQGMSVFEAIQKLCNLRGCLALSDREGQIIITRAGETKAATDIVFGVNLLEGSATYDYTERFSDYIVKGQRRGDDNVDAKTAATAKGKVTDSNVKRYRPMLVIADGQADKAKADVRARWEAAVRRGKSRSYEVTVHGWKDSGGNLWEINQIVTLKVRPLGINGELLIASVSFLLDDSGEKTRLKLVPPETYTPVDGDTVAEDDTWEDDLRNLGSLGGLDA